MEHNRKILVIEDDTDINNLIRRILEKQGYHITQSFSGTEACLRLELEQFDLLILDLMLPGMDGENVLRKLRSEVKNPAAGCEAFDSPGSRQTAKQACAPGSLPAGINSSAPVIILSAKSALSDKVRLLTTGADDYMTKPFEPEELLARVFAALRRSGQSGKSEAPDTCLVFKNLKLFPEARKITVGGQEVALTPHEFDILSILVQEPDKVFSRETLYERVWSSGYYGEDNTVNVHVSNIRKKIGAADPDTEYIKTVWGIGFKMA